MPRGTKSQSKVETPRIDPMQLGAKPCPRCDSHAMEIDLRSIEGARFAVISCKQCPREATSEVHRFAATCVQQAVQRWNSHWPETSYFLDADSEGIRILT